MSNRTISKTAADSPFVPGARVALRSGHDNPTYREGFVEKVYKNGNFTLRDGNRQQWRPSSPGHYDNGRWRAYPTGSYGWNRDDLVIWNETTDAEIQEGIALQQRRTRLSELRHRVDRLRVEHVTDAMLDAIQAELNKAGKP